MSASDVKSEPKSVGFEKDLKTTYKTSTTMPKDGQVMVAILKDMGVMDFEPRVVNQLLEFSYRYATNILEDSKVVSAHAKKKAIDVDDVKLAVQMYAEQNVTTPPSRDFLLDMARVKNAAPLPIPKPTCGLRLPPDRHCLTACNYRIKFKPKPKPPGFGSTIKTPGVPAARYAAGLQKMVLPQQQLPGFSVMNSPSIAGIPKPMIKINQQLPMGQGMPKIQLSPQVQNAVQQPVFKISVNPQTMQTVTQPVKRKAEEMDNNY